jgi:hypothetical protein
MASITIRDVPEDVHTLLKAQADTKGTSQNEYLLGLISRCALAGSPSLQQIMPDATQFVIRSMILADDERRQAYTEAQLRLIRENMEVLKRVEVLLLER